LKENVLSEFNKSQMRIWEDKWRIGKLAGFQAKAEITNEII